MSNTWRTCASRLAYLSSWLLRKPLSPVIMLPLLTPLAAGSRMSTLSLTSFAVLTVERRLGPRLCPGAAPRADGDGLFDAPPTAENAVW